MATLEMRRMRDQQIENDERKRLSITEKNKILTNQIYQIVEYMAKAQSKQIFDEKQQKGDADTDTIKQYMNGVQHQRLANGVIGGKKKPLKKSKN